MAILGAIEISGLDLPQFQPAVHGRYLDPATTLFVINDTSQDVEKNIRLNQLKGITSGVSPAVDICSGIVRRDFPGFSLQFKTLLAGTPGVLITSSRVVQDGVDDDGLPRWITGLEVEIGPNFITSGYNLGWEVFQAVDYQTPPGTLKAWKEVDYKDHYGTVYAEGVVPEALKFRSITGVNEAIVSGKLGIKYRQMGAGDTDPETNFRRNIKYTAQSGTTDVEGERVSLPWWDGQWSPDENLISISDQGAQIGFITLNDDPIKLDFSCDRVLLVDMIGYRGVNKISKIDFDPINLKVGTVITMIMFPRAPYENLDAHIINTNPQSLFNLHKGIFNVVGKNPSPFTNHPINQEETLQPVRMHFLCVKDDILDAEAKQGAPSILISFNDIMSDFYWNTNLWLGDSVGTFVSPDSLSMTKQPTEAMLKTFPPNLNYPIRGIFSLSAKLKGRIPDSETSKIGWAQSIFSENRGPDLPISLSDITPDALWLDNGPEDSSDRLLTLLSSLCMEGLNHTFLFGSIDNDKTDSESHVFFTGYDYRYKNTGLNLP